MSAEPLLVPAATVHAPNAMVATVDSLATQAGLALLEAGGSAADAAVGANAVLAVTAPNLCGMGGDLFALVHDGAEHRVELTVGTGHQCGRERVRRAATGPVLRGVAGDQ